MKNAFILFIALCLIASFAACSDENVTASSEAEATSSEAEATSSEAEATSSQAEATSSQAAQESSEAESNETADESNESAESSTAESEADESKAETFDASLLIGTWKRTATEAEGDTNDGGDCTITITGSGKDDLKISYYDKAFPDTKFSEKPITIVDSNTDSEIPEGSWRAVVDYVGAYDTKYDFEIAEDGTLVFCNSFEIDGAPMVSIEIFEKTE